MACDPEARPHLCRRWRCYANFRRDVGPKPTWAHLVIRDDVAAIFHRTPVAGRLRNRIGRRARLRGPVDPRLPPLRLSLPAYCGRGAQQLHDHHQRRACHPKCIAALRSPKLRSPLGRQVLRNDPPFLPRWLAQPAPLPTVEHAEPPQAVHRAMRTVFETKSGGHSSASRRGVDRRMDRLCQRLLVLRIFHEVTTSFERAAMAPLSKTQNWPQQKHSVSSAILRQMPLPQLSCSRVCPQNGHVVSMGVPLKASQPAGPICPSPLITIDALPPNRPIDIQ